MIGGGELDIIKSPKFVNFKIKDIECILLKVSIQAI